MDGSIECFSFYFLVVWLLPDTGRTKHSRNDPGICCKRRSRRRKVGVFSLSQLVHIYAYVCITGDLINRTYVIHNNLYISPFLQTIFGPINYGPRNKHNVYILLFLFMYCMFKTRENDIFWGPWSCFFSLFVLLVLLCSRTRHPVVSFAFPMNFGLFRLLLVFPCLTVCDHRNNTPPSRILRGSGRTQGALMKEGRNDRFMYVKITDTHTYSSSSKSGPTIVYPPIIK